MSAGLTHGTVGCGQLVGALRLADVDDRRTAESLLPLAVLGGDALDQHIDRLPVLQNLDLTGLLDVGRQHPRAEIGEPQRGLRIATNWPKRLWITASRSKPSRAAPARLTSRIRPWWSHRKYATGAKSNRSQYLSDASSAACLGALEFLVLHLQFDLMHLQLVDQGAGVRFGHGQSRSGFARVQTLLRLRGA